MARVTIYMPDDLHERWRQSCVNLSKLCRSRLLEILDGGDCGVEAIPICVVCEQRVARALHLPASDKAEVRTIQLPAPVASRNGASAA